MGKGPTYTRLVLSSRFCFLPHLLFSFASSLKTLPLRVALLYRSGNFLHVRKACSDYPMGSEELCEKLRAELRRRTPAAANAEGSSSSMVHHLAGTRSESPTGSPMQCDLLLPTQPNTLNDLTPNPTLLSLVPTPIRSLLVNTLHRSDLLDGLIVGHALLHSRVTVHFRSLRLETLVAEDLGRGSSGTGG